MSGIGQPPPLNSYRAARVQQHVGDPRDRDEARPPGCGAASIPRPRAARCGVPIPFDRCRSRSRTPPPGRPICPSIAASATSAQNGCSPCSARCSDQLAVKSVRFPRNDSASATMRFGRDAGDRRGPGRRFGTAVAAAVDVRKNRSPPVQQRPGTRGRPRRVRHHVREREHQRGVGVGADRQPLAPKRRRRHRASARCW